MWTTTATKTRCHAGGRLDDLNAHDVSIATA